MAEIPDYCSHDGESTSGRDSVSETSEESVNGLKGTAKKRRSKIKRFLHKKLFPGHRRSIGDRDAISTDAEDDGGFWRSKTESYPRSLRGDLPDFLSRANTFHHDKPEPRFFRKWRNKSEGRFSTRYSYNEGQEIFNNVEFHTSDPEEFFRLKGCLPISRWKLKANKNPNNDVFGPKNQGFSWAAFGRNPLGSLAMKNEFTAEDFMAIWGSCGLTSSCSSGSSGKLSPKGILEAYNRRLSGGSGSEDEKGSKAIWTLEKLASMSFGRSRGANVTVVLPSPNTCEKLRKEIEDACNPSKIEAARIRIMKASYAAIDAQIKLDQLQLDPLMFIVHRDFDFPNRAGHWRQHSVMTVFQGTKPELEAGNFRFRRSTSLPTGM